MEARAAVATEVETEAEEMAGEGKAGAEMAGEARGVAAKGVAALVEEREEEMVVEKEEGMEVVAMEEATEKADLVGVRVAHPIQRRRNISPCTVRSLNCTGAACRLQYSHDERCGVQCHGCTLPIPIRIRRRTHSPNPLLRGAR